MEHPALESDLNECILAYLPYQARNETSCLLDFVLATIMMLLAVIGVVTNSIVILLIALTKSLRSTSFCLIFNLAVADLIVGLFSMPLHAANLLFGGVSYSDAFCSFSVFADYVPVLASFLTTVAIATNRYDSLGRIQSRSEKLRKNVLWIVAAWSFSIGVWIAGIYQGKPTQLHGPNQCTVKPSENQRFAIFATVCAHHVPSLLLIYFNSVIMVSVRRLMVRKAAEASNLSHVSTTLPACETASGNIIQRASRVLRRSLTYGPEFMPDVLWLAPLTVMLASPPTQVDQSSRESQVVQSLGAILVMHVVLFLPSFIMYDIDIATPMGSNYDPLRHMFYINTAANPFLYAFSAADFQRVYREKVCLCR
ncbi:hypothetical protein PoB_007155900 [Plakobranchus ocellatus]|uniref:G-protein coupled receptors family 1 profile domain-containing protein n=1 Tax=Plakobranchus ocellatus TaxID=259542 RepID=A0AAV4DLJ4_9GAST|nr:hypothetical protein PoB_007155900 [Plakobranchus ocellatus]